VAGGETHGVASSRVSLRSTKLLGRPFNPNNLTEFHFRKSVEKFGHQWLKVNETIGSRSKDHNGHWQIGRILLKC